MLKMCKTHKTHPFRGQIFTMALWRVCVCVAQRPSPLLAKCHTFGQGRIAIAKCAIIAFVARGRRPSSCKIYAVSFGAATRTQLEIVTLVSEREIISRIKYTQRGPTTMRLPLGGVQLFKQLISTVRWEIATNEKKKPEKRKKI